MDHIRVSGTEPPSVILSHTKYLQKLKSDSRKMADKAEVKRDGCNKPKVTISMNFNTVNFDALKC